ncbi:probable nucleoside diphosphate kinase 5 [Acyrthosiphon pisum]|uniref:Nucleoside diphosphate kinase-like domain-containing protein n=1 Tax=Acyrthosiphon pisum TaxID=7029 RepID=A0A8R1W5K3_ACYPI|nr:probable nucleoside diphosphate kinase 5 [Acyrthosiphon pisum]|eukprot:XP_003245033.1 PREDICTED: probable nucleoside diphosphate kinase 5 [Acyrthosiphon pisum]
MIECKLFKDKKIDDSVMFRDSYDSLGTRTLPGRDRSSPSSSICPASRAGRPESASGQVSGHESLPVLFSDVPLFDGDDDDGGERTFQCTLAIIKPEVTRLMHKVECVMAQNGFIVIMKEVLRLSRDQAAEFYAEHALATYFTRLVDHMSGDPIVVYVLSKRNCVEEWQRLIGPADVPRAKRLFPVSLRAIYGVEKGPDPVANAFHGSDSPAAAEREIKYFFPNMKLDPTTDVEDDLVEYIKDAMMPTISKGLSEMFNIQPNDPLRWFGNWLLTRN